jgi:hypothetical protein
MMGRVAVATAVPSLQTFQLFVCRETTWNFPPLSNEAAIRKLQGTGTPPFAPHSRQAGGQRQPNTFMGFPAGTDEPVKLKT